MPAKTAVHPDLPRLLAGEVQAITPGQLRELARYIGTQATTVRDDPRDRAHDRLFARIMARADLLQEHRAVVTGLARKLQLQPWLWPFLMRCAGDDAGLMLREAGLLADDRRARLQVLGVSAVLGAVLRAWINDTSADLSATLRAADTGLRRAGQAAAWLGFTDPL